MAKKKVLICKCGNIKTATNTVIQTDVYGNKHFRYRCKECNSAYQLQLYWKDKTTQELEALRDTHLKRAKTVEEELARREDLWK